MLSRRWLILRISETRSRPTETVGSEWDLERVDTSQCRVTKEERAAISGPSPVARTSRVDLRGPAVGRASEHADRQQTSARSGTTSALAASPTTSAPTGRSTSPSSSAGKTSTASGGGPSLGGLVPHSSTTTTAAPAARSGGRSTSSTTARPTSVTSTASSGGLTITLTATPSRGRYRKHDRILTERAREPGSWRA